MNHIDIAKEIAHHHARLQVGRPIHWDDTFNKEDEQYPETTHAVLRACRRLGFIEDDIQVIASAWEAQMQRTTSFDPLTWPHLHEDFGIRSFPKEDAFAPCPHKLGLYAVVPDAQWVDRLTQAGVGTLQLRFKSEDKQAIAEQIKWAIKAVQGTSTLLFINDYWQLAIDDGAYGVHLGQEDMEEAPLEKIKSAGLRLGLSTHGYAEMLKADAHSPSYLALGAVFSTTLKRMKTAPQGLGRLQAYAHLIKDYPLVAIGGIDEQKIPAVLKTGVGSIAMVRAITGSNQPELVCKKLMSMMA
ncbi:MAG: thiamine phosphate synthase [Limnohabitans sp.]|nr:thiamine phosphate synthase [Limnohabitans sp.]